MPQTTAGTTLARWLPYLPLAVLLAILTVATLPTGGIQQALDAGRSVPKSADFPHYFLAAAAILNQTNIYQSWEGGYVYPPLLAAALTPLVPLGIDLAAFIWWLFVFGLLLCLAYRCLSHLARTFNFPITRPQAAVAAAIPTAVLFDPIRTFLHLGQTDSLILLGVALPLIYLTTPSQSSRILLPAFALALSVHIKFFTLALVLLYTLHRQLRFIAVTLLFVVLLALLPALLLGWQTNLDYLHASSARLLHIFGLPAPAYGLFNPHPLGWERSRSILSGLARITTATGLPAYTPYLAATLLLTLLTLFIARIYRLKGYPLRARFTQSASLATARVYVLDWTLFLSTLLAFSPQLPKRYLVALLPAFLLASLLILQPTTPTNHRNLLTAALAIVFVACLLPTSSTLAFHSPQAVWNSAGTVGLLGWSLLAFALTLLHTALPPSSASITSLPPAADQTPPSIAPTPHTAAKPIL
jgi:hypothetical protein